MKIFICIICIFTDALPSSPYSVVFLSICIHLACTEESVLNKEINAFNAFTSVVRVKWDKGCEIFCLLQRAKHMKRDHENYNHSISELNSILVSVMDTATQNQNLWLDLSEREVYCHLCSTSHFKQLLLPGYWHVIIFHHHNQLPRWNYFPILQVGKLCAQWVWLGGQMKSQQQTDH